MPGGNDARPNFIPPCVRVGPSSTTSTAFPATNSGWSSSTTLSARRIVALGFSSAVDRSIERCDWRSWPDLVDQDDVRHP